MGRTGNNVRKYLLYAIGEILLVVIGIFTVLQINNWNEEQIWRDPEQVYLQNLIGDLECHLFELARQRQGAQFVKKAFTIHLLITELKKRIELRE